MEWECLKSIWATQYDKGWRQIVSLFLESHDDDLPLQVKCAPYMGHHSKVSQLFQTGVFFCNEKRKVHRITQ